MPDVRNLHHNTHDRNHLLIQAVKKVAADHIKSEQKGERPDYSFEDWEYIFYLMGVLEPDPAFQSELKRSDNSAEHLNRAKSSGSMLRIRTRSSTLGGWTDGNGALDWLHGQNPLNVTDTLTEWMLLTLVEKLELELLDMRKKMGNTHVEETPNEIAAEDTLVEESTGVADPSV
jgi:potassium channel subfamily K